MSSVNNFLSILIINIFIASTWYSVAGQEVPPTPCPDVFQYYQKSNGDVYGRITVPYDGSTTLNLGVNASMKGYYTNKQLVQIKIKINTDGQDLIHERATTLGYSVFFPFQHTIPKITNIELNNKRYCTGPPEELIPGTPGVTSLWSGHKYYFQKQSEVGEPQEGKPAEPAQDIGKPISPSGRDPDLFSPSAAFNRFDNSIELAGSSGYRYPGCGVAKVATTPLILGGTEISDGMFPWLTAMFASVGIGYEYKCTANLISEKHVITAARCVTLYQVPLFATEDLLFVFGKTNLRNWAANGAVTRGASKIKPHLDFDPASGNGDIAVITLNSPLKFSSSIAPICLWSGNNDLGDIVNKQGTVAGWGADKKSPKPSEYSTLVAKSLDIPVVSQDKCLNSNLSYYSLTSETTFCAGERDGTGTCIGDSGAGFIMFRKEKFYLRGLASVPLLNEKNECDTSFFMVFCDAAKYTDFITDAMKE